MSSSPDLAGPTTTVGVALARSLGLSTAFVALMHVWPHGRTRPRDHPTLIWQRMLSCCVMGSVAVGCIAAAASSTPPHAAPPRADVSGNSSVTTCITTRSMTWIATASSLAGACARHPSLAAPVRATAILFSGVVVEHALLVYGAFCARARLRRVRLASAQHDDSGDQATDDGTGDSSTRGAATSGAGAVGEESTIKPRLLRRWQGIVVCAATALCSDSRAAAEWIMHTFPALVPQWRALFCPLFPRTVGQSGQSLNPPAVETARAVTAHQLLQWTRDAVIAPVSEELVFRMVIQDIEMRRVFPGNAVARVVATAVVFSIVHAHHAFELTFVEKDASPTTSTEKRSFVRKLFGGGVLPSVRRKPSTRPPLAFVVAPFVFGLLGGSLLELGRSSAHTVTAAAGPRAAAAAAAGTASLVSSSSVSNVASSGRADGDATGISSAIVDTVALAFGLSAAHSLCNVLRQPQFARMRPGVALRLEAAGQERQQHVSASEETEEEWDPYVAAGYAVPPVIVRAILPLWHVLAIIAFTWTLAAPTGSA